MPPMSTVTPKPGSLARARAALRGADFRKLFAIRLVGQCGDGFFQAALITSVVFSPREGSTAVGLFKAGLITALPFTVLGPFVGVFIDRWSRRRILQLAPLAKAALVALVLFDPDRFGVPFYLGALAVISVNRFYLSSASAVVPRLVPVEDLLVANSMATVGGTVALLTGVFLGGKVADASGAVPVVAIAAAGWLAASAIAARIRSELNPLSLPARPELLRHEARRVLAEMRDGAGKLFGTPRAVGPITSITVDQIGQGVILTLALVVFREEFGEGVGSFSNVVGAGGVGVLLGIATVGWLEDRFAKERIVAGAFAAGGLALVGTAIFLNGTLILVASGMVGLTFAWKKIPVDTLVQESLPDGYRGRVFSVYDVFYNSARVIAAALAIPMIPVLGTVWSLVAVGAVFLAWAPILPLWIRGVPEISLVFYEGARAEEWPRAIRWGAAEEPVEVVRAWVEEREAGPRSRSFRLRLGDGALLDVSRIEPDGTWRIDRQRES